MKIILAISLFLFAGVAQAFSPGVSEIIPPRLVPNVPTGEQILPMVITEAIE